MRSLINNLALNSFTDGNSQKKFQIDFGTRRKYPSWYRLPPKLYFGFGLNNEDMVKYYCDFPRCIGPSSDSLGTAVLNVVPLVEARLSKLCRYKDQAELGYSPEYAMALHLYDSHAFQTYELEGDEEQDVI